MSILSLTFPCYSHPRSLSSCLYWWYISNNSELQHHNLGWYISNIKQLRIAALQSWLIYSNIKQVRIAALQSWLIYFKYQRTQNCSMTMLVVSNTCDALRDLISFMQFKKRKKHPWRIVTFSKNAGFSLQPYCSNGTNSHNASHICFV